MHFGLKQAVRFCAVLKIYTKISQSWGGGGVGLVIATNGLLPPEIPSHSHLAGTKVWSRSKLEALESHMGGVGSQFWFKKT